MGLREEKGLAELLVARELSFAYHGVKILRGIDLAVRRGEMLGLIGPNGAGKSSLIKVIAGITRSTAGIIHFEGRPLETYCDRERGQRIAVMRQNPKPGFAYPVYDVVAMGRYPHKRRLMPLDDEDRRAIEHAMETAGVANLRERAITTLSGGEMQRVYLARALAQQPDLLFLDEPTANLDIRYQLEILALIRRLNREKKLTVVVAIHDLTLALRFCDRLAVISRGELVALGDAESVLTDELLSEVFGVRARVQHDAETGAPRVDYVTVV